MVGEMEGTEEELLEMEARHEKEHAIRDVYVYTHKRLSIAYNGDHIIEVNLTSDNPVPAKEGQSLTFTYEVVWSPTNTPFSERFNRYLDFSFFENSIHWFSIFNSFMMVVFLCGLVALILVRTLNNDYARFTRHAAGDGGAVGDSEPEGGEGVGGGQGVGGEGGLGDESGWKQVHGDAFRAPDRLPLLSACVGTGAQMVVVAFVVVFLSIVGSLYVDRGALVTAVLIVYALSSIVAGYVSGSLYRRYESGSGAKHAAGGGKAWIRAMVLTTVMFPAFAVSVLVGLNSISLYYATINVIPLSAFLSISAVFLFVSAPLAVIGTMLGRHAHAGEGSDFPCRVNALPRPIPERTFFTHPLTVVLSTGVLPFGAVFIEIFFLFSSMWSHKYYYVYGFLLLVLIILIVVSVCVTVVAVYFQLNSEDWRWPWTSLLASGSTALYVFLYGVYYFHFKTSMTGFIQTAYFFGYLVLFSVALGFMCGSIGFLGAFAFVRRIFRNIKVD